VTQHILSAAFVCPECGKQLYAASGNMEFQAEDLLICPDHGEIGMLSEIQEEAADFAARQIGEAIAQIFEDVPITPAKK
jgi:hypothetical protein